MSDEENEEPAPEAEEEAPAEEAAPEEEGAVAEQVKSMAAQFNADQAKGWSKTLMITVTGEGGGSWQFIIKDGKCEVKAGELPNANLKVTVDAATWASMMDGKTSGTKAFMSGKLKVKGPMGDLVKMGKVFPGLV